jgi:hypothetical protein
MGPEKYEQVGKSQSVLMMIHPMRSPGGGGGVLRWPELTHRPRARGSAQWSRRSRRRRGCVPAPCGSSAPEWRRAARAPPCAAPPRRRPRRTRTPAPELGARSRWASRRTCRTVVPCEQQQQQADSRTTYTTPAYNIIHVSAESQSLLWIWLLDGESCAAGGTPLSLCKAPLGPAGRCDYPPPPAARSSRGESRSGRPGRFFPSNVRDQKTRYARQNPSHNLRANRSGRQPTGAEHRQQIHLLPSATKRQ